jgi:hypothetical protein
MTVDYEPFELYAIAWPRRRQLASILGKHIKRKDQERALEWCSRYGCIERYILGFQAYGKGKKIYLEHHQDVQEGEPSSC